MITANFSIFPIGINLEYFCLSPAYDQCIGTSLDSEWKGAPGDTVEERQAFRVKSGRKRYGRKRKSAAPQEGLQGEESAE